VDPFAIVLIVLAVLVLLLFAGGYVANAKRRDAERAALHARAQEADRELAAAHAEDNGWERASLEAAARSAFAERHGVEPRELRLVQVVDRPAPTMTRRSSPVTARSSCSAGATGPGSRAEPGVRPLPVAGMPTPDG
jgi:hypothetical protein